MSGGQQEARDYEQVQRQLAVLDDHLVEVCESLFDPMFGPVTVRPVVKLINDRLGRYGFRFVRSDPQV